MKLPKTYEPKQYENDIYSLWERSEAFVPKHRSSKESFSIVLPPPNANGNLHVGHSLMFAVQDAVIRYQRMQGKAVLWVPGSDHAGFETQVVYEKKLAKEGKSRFDFSRDELYQQIWEFVAENKTQYETQFRRLGASLDWTRYVYTLDAKIIKQAYATFKKMWDEELIYRGERLVNFCTFHGTSFADIEVTYKDVPGHLWHIKYPLSDDSGSLTVATTRPETMLGDTAVAVHPEDERYKKYLGKTIKLPLTQREIPIIADGMVDMEFGTGAVKITPAHDPNDFAVAERHDLPKIKVIDHEGKMAHDVSPAYRGLTVDEARKMVVSDLKEMGFLEKEGDYNHSVGHCYKCGTIIQPLLREQWFVDMKPLATQAIKALRAGEITFYPEAKKDQLITYLKGLRDWNISRQIAWGIPIPGFQNIDDPDDWIYDERVDQETIQVDKHTYRRDPDVFDTWFSSSSWPYATMDYPDGEDNKHFYPNSLMETGGEILYPWVSRMIMLGLYVTGKVPFKEVYIHGYVMAEDGAKMSKSIGNVIDPMAVIDQFGSDALRMGLIAGRVPAVNRGYDPRKVEEARNFANKLWNIARFIEDKFGDEYRAGVEPKPTSTADHWILNKVNYITKTMSSYLESYRFSEAYELLYHFVWDDLADWYIETAKVDLNKSVLAYTLETTLKLVHPLAPFVTEAIYQTLTPDSDNMLIISLWPKAALKADTKSAGIFDEIKSIVSEIRFIKGRLSLKGLNLYHSGEDFLTEHASLIKALGGLESVQAVRAGSGLRLTQTRYKAWLDIDQQSTQRFLEELKTKKLDQEKLIKQLEARLANKNYTKNAPKQVVDETKTQLAEARALLANINEEASRFSL